MTGVSTGIGRATALELAEQKNRIILTARSREKLETLAEEIRAAGSDALVLPADVTDRERVFEAHREATDKFGPIDILFTCQGAYDPFDVTKFDSVEIAHIMNVNYNATLHCVNAVLPSMIERKNGYLVVVASIVAFRGLPNSSPYGATKAALNNFFEGLRFDVAKYGIDVTIVNPGFVKTPLTDKNEFEMPYRISPDEAADHIVAGMQKGKPEIHFPWQFTWPVRLMSLLPHSLYSFIIRSRVAK